MTKEQTRKISPVKTNYLVDLAILTAFLVTFDPRATGMAIHEWLGIAFGAAIVVHLLLHWQWLVASTRRFLGKLPRQTRVNFVLNSLLFIAVTLMVASGLMISESALPAIGIHVSAGHAWRGLHAQASDFALILLGLHIALHWKWILSTTKRYVLTPLLSRRPRRRSAVAYAATVQGSTEEVGA